MLVSDSLLQGFEDLFAVEKLTAPRLLQANRNGGTKVAIRGFLLLQKAQPFLDDLALGGRAARCHS